MKKIVALVLSLVMVLGLATTAFAANVPQWVLNNPSGFDIYDGNNVKCNDDAVKVEYHPAVAPTVKNDYIGNIAYYQLDLGEDGLYVFAEDVTYTADSCFVLVKAYEAGCIAVKSHDVKVDQGVGYYDVYSQSVPTATYFLKPVKAVSYNWTAEKFADFGTMCGDIAKPDFVDEENNVVARWTKTFTEFTPAETVDIIVELDDGVEAGAGDYDNFLVDGVIYTAVEGWDVEALIVAHKWVASEYSEKDGSITKYTCATCKVVGTVVASPFLAPADAEIEQLDNLTYVYFYTAAKAPAGDKVESAQTFDAGIAMYVGMSVMAAAGSAVVLKKKD